ncbi:hypothetical protein [Deinococcus yavapaiensis]|uniref:Uncharacterized protein n=1 Tax=Deinococcus yavapaiensis KR-236 TaxID=694435 RepID=A0A318S8G2_9DEIO|nr:hypothetical protein [Deinococcus yavapaiensis]PYE54815.1 hypothetical protein DES52_10485 [Deinococcus yavapaiensis KR-236]
MTDPERHPTDTPLTEKENRAPDKQDDPFGIGLSGDGVTEYGEGFTDDEAAHRATHDDD